MAFVQEQVTLYTLIMQAICLRAQDAEVTRPSDGHVGRHVENWTIDGAHVVILSWPIHTFDRV